MADVNVFGAFVEADAFEVVAVQGIIIQRVSHVSAANFGGRCQWRGERGKMEFVKVVRACRGIGDGADEFFGGRGGEGRFGQSRRDAGDG